MYCEMPCKDPTGKWWLDTPDKCGYLVGGFCKRNPERPFLVTRDIFAALKIVGCSSFGKYLDYRNDNTLGPCCICKQPAVTRDCGQIYCKDCAKKLGLK
jgi:hypothetical protein